MLTIMSSNDNSSYEGALDHNDNIRPSTSIQKSTGATSSVRRGRRRSSNSTLPCPTCGELYSRRDNLRVHQRVHSGEKPFKCEYCGARFRWVGVLRTHEATHRRRGEALQSSTTTSLASPNSSNSTTVLPQHHSRPPPAPSHSHLQAHHSSRLNPTHVTIPSGQMRQTHSHHSNSHSHSHSQHHSLPRQQAHAHSPSQRQSSQQDITITINMLLSDENEDYSDNRRPR